MITHYHIKIDNESSVNTIVTLEKSVIDVAIAAFITDLSIIRMLIDKEEAGHYTRIFTSERSFRKEFRNGRNDSFEKK